MKTYRLYKRPVFGGHEYLWIDPEDKVIFNRQVLSIGFLENYSMFSVGTDITHSILLKHDFKKVNTKMTQAELQKGWLI